MIHTGVLGALLTFGPPWYPLLAVRSESAGRGMSALEDQQLAGLIMRVPMGLIYFGAAFFLALSGLGSLSGASAATPPVGARLR